MDEERIKGEMILARWDRAGDHYTATVQGCDLTWGYHSTARGEDRLLTASGEVVATLARQCPPTLRRRLVQKWLGWGEVLVFTFPGSGGVEGTCTLERQPWYGPYVFTSGGRSETLRPRWRWLTQLLHESESVKVEVRPLGFGCRAVFEFAPWLPVPHALAIVGLLTSQQQRASG